MRSWPSYIVLGCSMTGTVVRLFRYPVKGLSPELLETLALTHAHGVERDRSFALALGSTEFDPAQPRPLAKTNFLMLARNEALARLRTRLDQDHRLVVRLDGRVVAEGVLDDPADRTTIENFFTAFMGEAARGRIRVVSAPGHRFTDIGAPVPEFMDCVSLINLASLRALEAAMGRRLDPLRFRANIYVDGLPAWSEFDWLGTSLMVGPVACRVVRRTRRCPATNVDPATAKRDADVPKALRDSYGHADLGVYLQPVGVGTVAPGDAMTVPWPHNPGD
jgi:uncharacterized protein YcbX